MAKQIPLIVSTQCINLNNSRPLLKTASQLRLSIFFQSSPAAKTSLRVNEERKVKIGGTEKDVSRESKTEGEGKVDKEVNTKRFRN